MKLIGSLTSPYVRKVRIVMAEKKLDYQFVLEDVWGSDAILKSNPLGKVPCLVMEGGEAVFDSRVIVEYVDTLSPVGKLIPPSGRERIEVRTWEALADGVLDAAHPGAPGGHLGRAQRRRSARQAWIDRQMSRGARRAEGDEPGPGRQALVRRQPLHAGRRGGGLRAGLPRLPLRRTSTGAASTPTWPSWPRSSPRARASSTPRRRPPERGRGRRGPARAGAGCRRSGAEELQHGGSRRAGQLFGQEVPAVQRVTADRAAALRLP